MEKIFLIRKAEISDSNKILELYDDISEFYNPPGWRKGIFPTIDTIKDNIEKNVLFILIFEEKILGACVIDNEQHPLYDLMPWSIDAKGNEVLVIHNLVSHPNYRKLGIGKN